MNHSKIWNWVIASVGGQGAITMNAVLGRAVAKAGLNISTAETHGMAQRYGRVTVHVRIGKDVHGALIPAGSADVLLGLEPLEALRSIEYCSSKTIVLLNRQILRPPSISISWHARYPNLEEIEHLLREASGELISLEAHELAKEAGSVLATNAVMMGVLCAAVELPIEESILKEALLEMMPPTAKDVNRRAFELGRAYVGLAKLRA